MANTLLVERSDYKVFASGQLTRARDQKLSKNDGKDLKQDKVDFLLHSFKNVVT